MLYLLYLRLAEHHHYVPVLNLLRYLTFRTGMTVVTAQLVVVAKYASAVHVWDLRAIRTRLKDMNLVLAAADQARVPMPSANNVRDRLLGAIAHGDGEKDWSVIAREQARASGLE